MNIILVFLNYFDVLTSKIIFKKLINIILIYFWVKNILKIIVTTFTNNPDQTQITPINKDKIKQFIKKSHP